MESAEIASSLCPTFVEEAHAKKILQELWRQFKNEEFCDVVLIAGTAEKRIPAHSNILSAASKYFKGMLSPNTAKEVKIANVDDDVIQSIVNYCYSGRIAITEDIVVKLLENANEQLLSDILPACENVLVEHLLPSNCLRLKLLAQKYCCETLLPKARDYILEHFMAVRETDEFLGLNADQLGELLACENLTVSSEEIVLNSLLAWLQYNSSEREEYQAELLKLVRLPLLKTTFLKEHVKPICTNTSQGCLTVYMEEMEHRASFYDENSYGRQSVKPRKLYQLLMAITLDEPKMHIQYHCPQRLKWMKLLMAITLDEPKMHIQYHCPQRLKWMKWSKDLEYRIYPGVAVMEDNFFIVGGAQSGGTPLNTVICLNLKTMSLKVVSPMTEHRKCCGAAVLNGILYAVGGANKDDNSLNSVEKWNEKTNTWSKVAAMEVRRSAFGIAVLNEKLYAIGGYSIRGPTNSAECYDAHQNVWTSIAPMHEARWHFDMQISVSNGLLYAVGGMIYIKTVERYNPATNCWTMLCSLNNKLEYPESCTSFRNKAIVCYKDRVEEYNEETNEWKTSESLKGLQNCRRIFTYSGELLTSEFVKN